MSVFRFVRSYENGPAAFAETLLEKAFGTFLETDRLGSAEREDAVCLLKADDPLAAKMVDKLPENPEEYVISVGENPLDPTKQAVTVVGFDEAGILYGAVDVIGEYMGSVLHRGCTSTQILQWGHFDEAIGGELVKWSKEGSPRIHARALWSWGHVIYDYRALFDNLALLKFNEVVIWNDYLPLNEKEIIDYAHDRGIAVYWGFAWGWDTNCRIIAGDREFVSRLKDQVVAEYEQQYKDSRADGIYFQSFTEMQEEEIGGVNVAEAVTEFVNVTVDELLRLHPDLKIQFGLHATSVSSHLDTIAKVDPRIRIVWEDCGAFPYAYDPANCEGFEDTLALTKELLELRSDADKGIREQYGAVLKGMITLDWTHFHHQEGRYIMGEEPEEVMRQRLSAADKIVKYYGAEWLTHADLFDRFITLLEGSEADPELQVLFEDGVLERRIPEAMAVYAALMWEHPEDAGELQQLIKTVRRCPFVS